MIDNLLDEKNRLNHKLATSTHAFNDVLIYCKKTIENQDLQVSERAS